MDFTLSVVVPSPISPTENQRQLLQDFVGRGGRLVVQEPQRLGFEVTSNATAARGWTVRRRSARAGC